MYLRISTELDQMLGWPGLAQPRADEAAQYQDIVAKVQGQLERRFRDPNDPELYQRRKELRRLFGLVPSSYAKNLYDRLQDSADPLGHLFRRRLAMATRNEMLRILLAGRVLAFAPKAGRRATSQTGSRGTPTSSIYLLIYFSEIAAGYPPQKALERILGPNVSQTPDITMTRWDMEGIQVYLKTDAKKFKADLEAALADPGAIVVLMAHTAGINRPKPIGIGPKAGKVELTSSQLTSTLNSKKVKAKAVILAACASEACLGSINSPVAVIATDSGKNRTTHSYHWFLAVEGFLNALVGSEIDDQRGVLVNLPGGPTNVRDAIAAANKVFARFKDLDDRFVLVGKQQTGDYTLK